MKTSMFVASTVWLALLAVTNAQAQVSIDVAKITCDQFAAYRITDPRNIAIWLSGYYNGLRKNTKLDLNQYRKNAEIIVAECKDSPKATVMQTIKTMTSRKKK